MWRFALVCVALLVIGIFRLRHPLARLSAKPLRRWGFSQPPGCAWQAFCHFPPASRRGRFDSSARVGLKTP